MAKESQPQNSNALGTHIDLAVEAGTKAVETAIEVGEQFLGSLSPFNSSNSGDKSGKK